MDIAEFIRSHPQEIIADWTRRVARLPGEASLSPPALVDHLPDLLVRMADWIDERSAENTGQEQRLASPHALQRLGLGFELRQIVAEYSLLRSSVLHLIEDQPTAAPTFHIARFNEAMDHAIAECVDAYSSAFEMARGRFVDILGHDLRNPLSVVSMAARMLQGNQSLDPATVEKLAQRIGRGARRMEGLIADLLDFARGRHGQGIPVQPAPANMADICQTSIDELAFTHPDARVTFEFVGDVTGTWDADRVTQAISNLVANALVHGQDPISVVARDAGDDVVVTVSNTGLPIDPLLVPTLFEPYQVAQLTSAGTDRTRLGLGLGLFIVREVVRAHGGSVGVRSDENGTEFTTRWPRSGEASGRSGEA